MLEGTVESIFISPLRGKPMESVITVEAIKSEGLKGDRYAKGEGSFNRGRVGKRQVTLINGMALDGSGFESRECRRNIVTRGVELMSLIGRQFTIGPAIFRGIKYCEPCDRPSELSDNAASFKDTFFGRGGIIAEVIESGTIRIGDPIIVCKD